MKIKTQDLTGHALRLAVLIADGGSYWTRANAAWPRDHGAQTGWILEKDGSLKKHEYSESSRTGHFFHCDTYEPDADWSQGGPIIERERIDLAHSHPESHNATRGIHCTARINGLYLGGPTPLIAAMRCYVSSRLGEEVEVPNELA